tara:strand:+ start:230 stop:472 length:243 start_codon:yes stop_codon:yes gene_type:complete
MLPSTRLKPLNLPIDSEQSTKLKVELHPKISGPPWPFPSKKTPSNKKKCSKSKRSKNKLKCTITTQPNCSKRKTSKPKTF